MESFNNKKLKFIHAADIHLGSIIHSSCCDSKKIDLLFKQGIYGAFENICKAAIDNNVDFLLLCGDVYDKENRTVKASEVFMRQCQILMENKINVYVIRGNHDPEIKAQELFDLPSNVYIFKSNEAESFDVYRESNLIARILGQSYKEKRETRKLFKNYNIDDNLVFNIALLHTQLETKNNNYVPCSSKELIHNKNINYWALGHIHKCKVIRGKNPSIIYPGIPQGRDLGEQGVGGCLLVEVSRDFSTDIKYIPISKVIWKEVTIKIDNYEQVENLNDLEEVLIEEGQAILNNEVIIPEDLQAVYNPLSVLDGYVVKWSIEGRGKIDEILREDEENVREYLIDALNKKFTDTDKFLFTDSIEFNTRPEIWQLKDLNENQGILKDMDNLLENILSKEDLQKDLVKNFGNVFEKKFDFENINEEKIQLDNNIFKEIIDDAREIVVEKLIEKGGES